MAQDLSQTIQDGLAQTLTDLLGIDTKFQETTKAVNKDLENIQLLQVNAEFEFDKLTTIFKFMIPASTASIIFNTMMGASDYEISDTIDDDTTDAMGEFVSNVSGSLVTAFNAKEIEELGKAKFHIQHKEVLYSSAIENVDTLYRFVINLDETPLTLFIDFDETFLPSIDEIAKSEPTAYPEEELPPLEEESIEELPQEQEPLEKETLEAENSDPKSIITDDKKEDSNEENDTEEMIEEADEEAQKKAKKMKLIIIIVSSLIALTLIVFLSLYFMSSDEDEMNQQEQKVEKAGENKEDEEVKKTEQEELKVTPNKTLKKVDFNIKEIDTARLNNRLATLTKFEILTKEELEAKQKEETKRLERLKKEEELKEFAKLNKEEPVKLQPKAKQENPQPKFTKENKTPSQMKPATEIKPTPQIKSEPTPEPIKPKETVQQKVEPVVTAIEEPREPQRLLFVLTNSIKYTLFKSLVLKTDSSTARISMCNDTEGRTTILIGPFENSEKQNKMDQLIKNSNETIETSLGSLTKEEFNQRCDF